MTRTLTTAVSVALVGAALGAAPAQAAPGDLRIAEVTNVETGGQWSWYMNVGTECAVSARLEDASVVAGHRYRVRTEPETVRLTAPAHPEWEYAGVPGIRCEELVDDTTYRIVVEELDASGAVVETASVEHHFDQVDGPAPADARFGQPAVDSPDRTLVAGHRAEVDYPTTWEAGATFRKRVVAARGEIGTQAFFDSRVLLVDETDAAGPGIAFDVPAALVGYRVWVSVVGEVEGAYPRAIYWTNGPDRGEGYEIVAAEGTPPAVVGSTPRLAGTVAVGSRVETRPGTWSEDAVLRYRWTLDGRPVPRADRAAYTPVAADRGKRLAVTVTGDLEGRRSTTLSSAATTVRAGTLRGATPRIRGTARVGRTLSAVRGSWTAGTTPEYRWLADGRRIPGATRATYRVTKAVRGKRLTVAVTGRKPGYAALVRVSARTARVR